MANIIHSDLQDGEVFSVHRMELKDENNVLCGTVAYVMCGQVTGQRDELDELILSALKSQYPKSSDNSMYFTKGSLVLGGVMNTCGVNIHNKNRVMPIDIITEAPIDISGSQVKHLALLTIPVIVYDVQPFFTTDHISILSKQNIKEYERVLNELKDNMCQYQEFMQ